MASGRIALGVRPGSHGERGERAGERERQAQRRPTRCGARDARRELVAAGGRSEQPIGSAAAAALPRIVRRSRHDYSDSLLASLCGGSNWAVASSAAIGLWSAPVPEARSRAQQPSPLDAAVALAPRIRAAAAETERQRRLSPELVRALAAGGVFRMCVPRALGGGEVDPATMIETIETIAAADGAAGWSAMIGATSGVASAYLAEEAAREIYGSDPEVVSGGAFAPLGKATVVDGGYRVSGRWPFASGCEHFAWRMGGSVVVHGGQPRLLPSGIPDNRLMLFPASVVRVLA